MFILLGAFAKVIFGIPVQLGHEGGRLNVHSPKYQLGQTSSVSFDALANGHSFFLAAFFADCVVEMAPITSGCLLTLEFKIVSTNSLPSNLDSTKLPRFFAALHDAKESLSSWADWAPQSQAQEAMESTSGKSLYITA